MEQFNPVGCQGKKAPRRRRARRVAALALALCFALPLFAPRAAAAAATPPGVAAGAYVVMDSATGQILLAGSADEAKYPASITKILTAGLVLEQVGLQGAQSEKAVVSQAAIDALIPRASMVALQPGEELRVIDLLYAAAVESANDAAHVLGEYAAGDMGAFAERMNQKADELGLTGSRFTNASGQPNARHYTTARDMAVITRWAMSLPGFSDIFSATEYTLPATNKRGAFAMHNSNLIFQSYSSYYCPGVTASKTGFTDDAGYTLVTTARRGDTELICVVLDCQYNEQKYEATNALLDYCFNNFARHEVKIGDIAPISVPVYGGGPNILGEIEVYAEGDVEYLRHTALTGESVSVLPEVPERYVVGQPFVPRLAISLAGGGYQQSGEIFSAAMPWRGLEEVLAANTLAPQAPVAAAGGQVQAWLWAAGLVILAALLAGRVLWVRHRRRQRRMRRLAAARLAGRVPFTIEPPEWMARRARPSSPIEPPEWAARNAGGPNAPLRVGTGKPRTVIEPPDAPGTPSAPRRAPAVYRARPREAAFAPPARDAGLRVVPAGQAASPRRAGRANSR